MLKGGNMKAVVEVKMRIELVSDEDFEVPDIMADLDYQFESNNERADVVDVALIDYEVVNTK